MDYRDSSSRAAEDTLSRWLEAVLADATLFAAQTGYFRFGALDPFRSKIEALLAAGGEFHLVVGANEERLAASDLEQAYDLLEPYLGTTSSLTLVGASDVLFHPKTYYVELQGGRRRVVVGSANLTPSGLARNVEAYLELADPPDDSATIDAVRDAILAWRARTGGEMAIAMALDRDLINQLAEERAIAPSGMASQQRQHEKRDRIRGKFPRMGQISGVPRTPPTHRPIPAPVGKLARAPKPFPAGAIGFIKRLSERSDVSGFDHRVGTPYVALPTALSEYLPLTPFGGNDEPRLDIDVQARLDHPRARGDVVDSGDVTTNVTFVGAGSRQTSHRDLRLNLLNVVFGGLRAVADRRGVPVPQGGDFIAVEVLDQGRLFRVTFATRPMLKAALAGLCTEGRGLWGWLPAGVLDPW